MKTMKTGSPVIILILCMLIFLLSSCSSDTSNPYLTIIHTNDIRSHLELAPQRITLINQIRGENLDSTILVLDSGDMISGTPYFTLYQGAADAWFLNHTNYDAVCLGNHEFDKGPVVLANFLNEFSTTVVCANIDLSKDKNLQQKIVPWAIIQKDGDRYGVFGLIPEETVEIASPGPTVSFTDHMAAARKALYELQSRGVTRIICLSNLNWDANVELAKKVDGIDVIVGSYSIDAPTEYPVIIRDDETPTLIVQAGSNGNYVGELKVSFNKDGIISLRGGSRLHLIDYTIIPDKRAAEKLESYQEPLNDFMETVIGETLVDLNGDSEQIRTQETLLGNLVADAMLEKGRKVGAEIALLNSGSIRGSIPSGKITLAQVMSVLPYDNHLVALDITGEQLVSALENGVSQAEEVKGRFPLVAGLKFIWNPVMPPGSRIQSVEVYKDGKFQKVTASSIYRIVTNSFLASGGDGYSVFLQAQNVIDLGAPDFQILADYLTAHSPVEVRLEGRIITTEK